MVGDSHLVLVHVGVDLVQDGGQVERQLVGIVLSSQLGLFISLEIV